jgi:hypothetical protein
VRQPAQSGSAALWTLLSPSLSSSFSPSWVPLSQSCCLIEFFLYLLGEGVGDGTQDLAHAELTEKHYLQP